jgi:HEAT repeat protein
MTTLWNHKRSRLNFVHAGLLLALCHVGIFVSAGFAQDPDGSRTPLQRAIEKQKARLSSAEVEERRDAVVHLQVLHHPEASRVAVAALSDISPIVRATATTAVLSLPDSESAASLIPLLDDKDEFVRQEAAYALGKTRSESAVSPLIERLARDKKHGVRGAAVVALGEIRSESGVVALSQILRPDLAAASQKKKKSKGKENVFVLRSAARSLGQIGSRAGVPALLAVVQDENAEGDVRREAANALGSIGDPAALPTLNSAMNASDPYLAHAAYEASRKISRRQ